MNTTQGPWFCRPSAVSVSPVLGAEVLSSLGSFVADCGSHEDADANARLIAAAPDLLEACRKFVDSFKSLQREKCDVAHRMAVAAIAKAEGR